MKPLLHVSSIILVAFLAIWLGMPHKRLDWDGVILPMAHKKMNLSTPTKTPLEDMIVVLTGSTSGIGLALTKTLVGLGATVIALGRSETKLQALQASFPNHVEPMVADLENLTSVAHACDEIQERFQRIDVLINNAGMHYKWASLHHPTTVQGYDQVFAVNYLSHFLLTERMLPLLQNSTIPTMIHISSSFHWAVDGSDLVVVDEENPIAATPGATPVWFWRDQRAYANSKLAQILHMRSIQRLYPNIRMACVCPGWVGTQIAGVSGSWRHAMLNKVAFDANDWGMASTLQALLSTSSQKEDDYYTNSKFADIFHSLVPLLSPSWVYKCGIRDAISSPLAFLMMPGQTFTTGVHATRSSPESYNTTIQDSLYKWSKETVAPFLK